MKTSCPKCKSRATKIFNINSGKFTCQLCQFTFSPENPNSPSPQSQDTKSIMNLNKLVLSASEANTLNAISHMNEVKKIAEELQYIDQAIRRSIYYRNEHFIKKTTLYPETINILTSRGYKIEFNQISDEQACYTINWD